MSATPSYYIAGQLSLSPYSGLVPIVLVVYMLVHVWMGSQVGAARKRYNIPLPSLYAVAGTPRHYGGSGGDDKEREKLAPSDASGGTAASLAPPSNIISEEDAFHFNCVQRGHLNTVENLPLVVALLLQNWLSFPLISGLCGIVWIVGRVLYFQGYSKSPKGRIAGAIAYVGLLGLLVLSLVSGAFFFMQKAPY